MSGKKEKKKTTTTTTRKITNCHRIGSAFTYEYIRIMNHRVVFFLVPSRKSPYNLMTFLPVENSMPSKKTIFTNVV